MHWLYLALVAPLLWSVSNHIDKYLVDRYLDKIKYTSFIITGTIFTVIFAIIILACKPDVVHIHPLYGVMLIGSGVLSSLYLFPYYRALALEEASIVVPMFQMIPIVGFILAYIFLGEHLTALQILAGVVIISGSLGLSLELSGKIRLKGKVFLLMFASSLLISLGVLMYKFVVVRTDYWTAIFWEQIGTMLLAAGLLSVRSHRDNFLQKVWRQRGKSFFAWEGLNEIISQSASLIFNFVYIFTPVALVQLVGSTQPFFVFLWGIALSLFWPEYGTENLSRKFLAQKIFFILLILAGSYLLFKT